MNPKMHFSKSRRNYAPPREEVELSPDPANPVIAGGFGLRGFASELHMRPDAPLPSHVLVTSQIMGDPEPGRSALDKQQMQVANIERGAPRGTYQRRELH